MSRKHPTPVPPGMVKPPPPPAPPTKILLVERSLSASEAEAMRKGWAERYTGVERPPNPPPSGPSPVSDSGFNSGFGPFAYLPETAIGIVGLVVGFALAYAFA